MPRRPPVNEKTFSWPHSEALPPKRPPPSSPCTPGNPVFVDVPILGGSYQRNHTTRGLLCLEYFTGFVPLSFTHAVACARASALFTAEYCSTWKPTPPLVDIWGFPPFADCD